MSLSLLSLPPCITLPSAPSPRGPLVRRAHSLPTPLSPLPLSLFLSRSPYLSIPPSRALKRDHKIQRSIVSKYSFAAIDLRDYTGIYACSHVSMPVCTHLFMYMFSLTHCMNRNYTPQCRSKKKSTSTKPSLERNPTRRRRSSLSTSGCGKTPRAWPRYAVTKMRANNASGYCFMYRISVSELMHVATLSRMRIHGMVFFNAEALFMVLPVDSMSSLTRLSLAGW